jgi:hypothetical protein
MSARVLVLVVIVLSMSSALRQLVIFIRSSSLELLVAFRAESDEIGRQQVGGVGNLGQALGNGVVVGFNVSACVAFAAYEGKRRVGGTDSFGAHINLA